MKSDWKTHEGVVVREKGKYGGGATSVKPTQKLLWYLADQGRNFGVLGVSPDPLCLPSLVDSFLSGSSSSVYILLCFLLDFTFFLFLPTLLFLIQLCQAKYNESLILIFLSWMHFPAPGNLISCFCSCQLIGVYV